MKERERSIEAYMALRKEIDLEVERLEQFHKPQMVCKKGCDLCCLNFSVFPVEFEAIRKETCGQYDATRTFDDTGEPGSCVF